jgi:hypothetical protein
MKRICYSTGIGSFFTMVRLGELGASFMSLNPPVEPTFQLVEE